MENMGLLLERVKEEDAKQEERLEAAAVEFQRTIDSFRKDSSEWLEPPDKKFRGAKGYLNGQNLPFYHRFS